MKKLLKYIGFALGGLLILFLFVVYFSATETTFQCTGEISYEGNTRPLTVYMKLAEYRPWVGLWGDSDGSINLEIPNEWVEYYGHVEEVGDQLQIHETYGNKALKGNYSKLSKTLAIDLEPPFGFFDGNCIVAN